MPVTSDPTKITFGQSNESMKLVHKFLEQHGVQNVDWDDNKFDEKTALGLLLVGSTMNCFQFVDGGGFNSNASKYIEGTTVVLGAGTKYYSSWNAKEHAGVITIPTTGTLISNGIANKSNALNPLMISLMKSPLEKALSSGSVNSNLTGSSLSTGVLTNAMNSLTKSSKQYGGYTQGEIVYVRPDSVIPSFSDILIGGELGKIMKAGAIVAKGIELVNAVNSAGKAAKQFLDNASNTLDGFLNKNKDRELSKKELMKRYNERLKALSDARNEKKAQVFNENGMFIKNLITDTVIYIPFRPDDVDESYSVSWQEQNTRGSSHATYGYEMTTGASPTITFDFDVGALIYYMTRKRDTATFGNIDVEEDLIRKSKTNPQSTYSSANISDQVFEIVASYLNSLKALAYPLYTGGIPTPPSCYISIARTFKFVGVCTNVNIAHKGPMYIRPSVDSSGNYTRNQETSGDQMFMNYSITLSFNKVVNQDFSADTVEVYGDNWTGGMDDSAQDVTSD